ncbi:Nucleolar protein 13 [Nakaseomyces glabratus]|uniref:Nucleolar protein 13 n=1 Tax=Candida glabrata TaxID=5478 RepID=A0A0W0E7J1_CANGB|nr:Eukaryotic RNA Recognition Motif (RRM) profile [Nakaseomyces glabratus]KAH7584292.1 Eukaryotic RNA Recognition Motif (RRM) profile [Nakaseomyces glabratus]KAH7585535.1 Eukaryotic RNA Recognition Motif (RRM) profile [Nakaseomyces glabratus]KAH7598036.1 Eukaryotic RNA Recognition Motif (RRM) profile [Nakaseomyces glabratus]KAH7612330.1 Eukaryotic RNA Recognition Motif (RRM) profile [Nakaseomyces glabratus]
MSDVEKEVKEVQEVPADEAEKIQKALSDPTKKRKAEDEIEIDLSQTIPLSKKQKRLLRRGKITLEELNAKFNLDPSSVDEFHKEVAEKERGKDGESKDSAKESESSVKDSRKNGVWIGNLSFDTTKEDITRFIVGKTKGTDVEITEEDLVRVNMPLAKNDGKQIKNKGFCYVDFKTQEQVEAAIKLSESQLNGRNLLIKNSKSYEGRPDKTDLVSMSKNPPSRILFVGNLSFDTTDDLLRKHFQHCGEIVKIRMATFQDSGKCKGFAFVDFKNEEGATNALKDKSCRKIAGRPLRMEFGEDRSKRQVRKRPDAAPKKSFDLPNHDAVSRPPREEKSYNEKKPRQRNYVESNNRVKSSIALKTAQRASAAIVPSQGKKITF